MKEKQNTGEDFYGTELLIVPGTKTGFITTTDRVSEYTCHGHAGTSGFFIERTG
jgi:hypothetical protein